MRLGVFYAVVLLCSLAAMILVQYDLRPPLILWDGRAIMYFAGLCFSLAFAAAGGLSTLIPTARLPPRLKSTPATATMFAVVTVFAGIINLSPETPIAEAAGWLVFGAALGATIGAVVSLITSVWPDKNANVISPADQQRRILIAIPVILVVGLALLIIPRSRDDAHFQTYGRYSGQSSTLEIGLSTGPFNERRAVMRFTHREARAVLVFDNQDWPRVLNLIRSAEHFPAGTWLRVGQVIDTTAPASTLEVSSGPGMRFVVTSEHHPGVEHVLSRSDFERFKTDLARVTADLRRE